MHPITFLVPYLMPLTFGVAAMLGGWAWLLVPAVVFLVLPSVDLITGNDPHERDDSAPRPWIFDALLVGWLPVQVGAIGWGLWNAASLSFVEFFGFALAAGLLTGGGGITIAHELCHRKAAWAQASAEGLMASVCYPWFTVEHVLGHHRNVATPVDPATSRLGENVYAFWFRSVTGGFRSAWHLETERVHTRGLRGLNDRRIRMPIELGGVFMASFAIGGLWGLGFFVLQGVVAFSLLEVINYVEHYGLQRKQLANGRYERVQPHHSWNSTHAFTNRFLFNLPRHADHHAFAYRPYDQLRTWPNAPRLPLGYPSMVVMALVPPLWWRVMNPRVAEVNQAQST